MQRMRFTIVHLLVCVLIVAVVGTFTLAIARRSNSDANRVRCAKTLRALTLAMKLYADENRGQFPRTIYNPKSPLPVWGTPYKYDRSLGPTDGVSAFLDDSSPLMKYRPAPNDVTAAIYLLLSTQDITPEILLCPNSGLSPLYLGRNRNVSHWTNLPGDAAIANHLSYSYSNPYFTVTEPQFRFANVMTADVPVLSDMNPGTESLLKLNQQDRPKQQRTGNSKNHGGDGQNVSYLDGHVEFVTTPFAGVQRDNIYTANGREDKYRTGEPSIIGAPVNGNDAIMLPTWEAVSNARR